MSSRSSLTTTRLAALSLSPSRIAQLGVIKPENEGSLNEDDSKHQGGRRGKTEEQERESHGGQNMLGVRSMEGKPGTAVHSGNTTIETPQRPSTGRRKSSLNSLDEDEDEEGSPRKESMNGVNRSDHSEGAVKAEEQVGVSNRHDKVNEDMGGDNGNRKHQSTASSSSLSSSSSPTLPQIRISSDVPTSPITTPIDHTSTSGTPERPRSPPPSYDFATSPSGLHRSSNSGYMVGGSRAPDDRSSVESARFAPGEQTGMTSRRKGKQRALIPDESASSVTSASPPSSPTNKHNTWDEHAMLELLPNSDTEGEDGTYIRPEEATDGAAGPSSHPISPAQRDISTPTISTADRLRPLLLPQARTRSFTPPLIPPTSILVGPSRSRRPGSRRAYTGPVQIIDRTGESEGLSDEEQEDGEGKGWMTPMSGTDFGTGMNTPVEATGYHLSPSMRAASPTSPLASSQTPTSTTATSAAGRHILNLSSDCAFTANVHISGWKIIGGRTKGVVSPSPLPSTVEGAERDGTGRSSTGHGHGHDVVELQKGRLGAYVVYECEITTRAGTKITRLRRYNDFLALYNALQRAFPNAGASLPPLPPKNRLSKFEPTYLAKRQVKLQFWLKCVLLHPSLGAHEACRKFVLDV